MRDFLIAALATVALAPQEAFAKLISDAAGTLPNADAREPSLDQGSSMAPFPTGSLGRGCLIQMDAQTATFMLIIKRTCVRSRQEFRRTCNPRFWGARSMTGVRRSVRQSLLANPRSSKAIPPLLPRDRDSQVSAPRSRDDPLQAVTVSQLN
jgi:hypothetical protein